MTVSVRLSVCVFVCLRGASLSLKLHVRSSPDLWSSYLWSWLGPPLILSRRCDLLCTSGLWTTMTSCLHPNVPEYIATRKGVRLK